MRPAAETFGKQAGRRMSGGAILQQVSPQKWLGGSAPSSPRLPHPVNAARAPNRRIDYRPVFLPLLANANANDNRLRPAGVAANEWHQTRCTVLSRVLSAVSRAVAYRSKSAR